MKNKEEKQKKGFQLKAYFAKHKLAIFLFVLVNVLAAVCSVFLTIMVAEMVARITESSISAAIMLCVWAIIITFAMRVFWYLSNYIYFKYSRYIMRDMSLDLAKQAFKFNSKTYADHDSGTFVQRIVSDPERLVGACSDIIFIGLDIITYSVILVYIALLNIWVTLGIIALLIFGFVLERFRLKTLNKNRKIEREANDKINSLTTEIVKSEKDIKSLDLETKLTDISNEKYLDYHKKAYKRSMVDCSFWSIRNFVLDVGMMAVLILGMFLMDAAMISMATFMIVYSWKNTVYDFVWSIGTVSAQIVEIKVCLERVNKLFDEDEYVVEKFGETELEKVKGKIEFKNVSYAFREYDYENKNEAKNKNRKTKNKNKIQTKTLVSENQVFKNLSFRIEPNTTVAFVGKSGSGKSTILNLISKMSVVDSGQVLIDGVNINDLTKRTLRNAVSLVNQFPYIFDMTIKDNLLLAKPDATDSEIYDAIKRASLKDFVDELKKGIDTKVGESGIKLSGGQRQRLAIARAMLRNSPITIFDESTSALDNFAQGDIKKSIDKMKGKSTIIIVAHRLSTIKNVDKIFFLDKGKVIDSGTFEELFERNEKFQAMFLAENI